MTWEKPNLRGHVFGRLFVEEPQDRRNPKIVIWRCVCGCGRVVFLSGPRLLSGKVKSCGICDLERFIEDRGQDE